MLFQVNRSFVLLLITSRRLYIQDVWYDETSLTFPSSRPRHNNRETGLTSANNNNPADIQEHTLKGIIKGMKGSYVGPVMKSEKGN